MRDSFDVETLTAEERLREVASLLARGYLRHRALRATGAASGNDPVPSEGPGEPGRQGENLLEASGDQSVHVPTAEDATPSPERS